KSPPGGPSICAEVELAADQLAGLRVRSAQDAAVLEAAGRAPLDPDVAAELKELARQRGVSFKEVLNDAVRAGLAAGTEARAYRLPTARLGLRPGVSLDGALRLAAAMGGEEDRGKLGLRKGK